MDLKPLIAALSSILAFLLMESDGPGGRLADEQVSTPSLSLVLALLGVAVRQGASLPRALGVVGGLLPGPYGLRMVRVAHLLGRGNGWDLSWSGAIGDPDYGQSMNQDELTKLFDVTKVEDFAADDPQNPINVQKRRQEQAQQQGGE